MPKFEKCLKCLKLWYPVDFNEPVRKKPRRSDSIILAVLAHPMYFISLSGFGRSYRSNLIFWFKSKIYIYTLLDWSRQENNKDFLYAEQHKSIRIHT